MAEYVVDVRCMVDAQDLGDAYNIVCNELVEHIMNSDFIKDHDYISVKLKGDNFYD